MELDQDHFSDAQPLFLAGAEPSAPNFALSKFRSAVWFRLSRFAKFCVVISSILALPVAVIGLSPKGGTGPVFFVVVVAFILAGILSMRLFRQLGQREVEHREQLMAELRAPFLPARVERVTEALQEATTLVEQLKKELDARTALLVKIKDQVTATTEQAADLKKLVEVDDDTTRALNRYFDSALKHRLGELEQGARRREWLLGTIGAIGFGIIAILLSHYFFGF